VKKRTSVRDARANLSELMKGTEAIAIGDYYRLRAVLVPIPLWPFGDAEQKQAAKKARAAFDATLRAQLD
jgi:hypothetical protein